MPDLRKLLDKMTIEEKIGQLMQFSSDVFADDGADVTGPRAQYQLTEEDMARVGSILGTNSAETVIKLQKEHLEKDRNKIPLLFMRDVIYGYRTNFPIPLGFGCSFDPALVAECSEMAAKEAAASGIHVTFTPMVDYVRDARWGRVMESCGEEPLLNSRMGAAQVKAFQGEDLRDREHIASCVKHFAAYGGAEAGRDYNTVDLSEHTLREFYLPAYKACVDAGVKMLMPSFNSLNGIPSTGNQWLMKKILREEWGYDGLVISDWGAISELLKHGIAADERQAARMAFDCGCHIEMCSNAYHLHLEELIEEGAISEEQLDDAVMKVLELKEELGLFEDPFRGASSEKEQALFMSEAHRAIAKKAAAESAVLLKNEGVLPFSEEIKRIALIGPFADEKKALGIWKCNGQYDEVTTVREGFAAALPQVEILCAKGCGAEWNDSDDSGFAEAIEIAKKADAVVLCLGEPDDYAGEGNCRTDISLPGLQNRLAKEIAAVNSNTAAVLFNGRPLVLSRLAEAVPAILELWYPGNEGGHAAADLLLGRANPCGKVSMSFPKATGQCPIYYNRNNTGRPKKVEKEGIRTRYNSGYLDCGNLPLYPFGHGLSYSNFIYEDLTLSADSMESDGAIQAKITIYNDSDRAGKEVVQLYMRDLVASMVRPVQQLIDFKKVEFAPYERKEITFEIREPMLRFWNWDQKFISEPGEFQISTGCADHLLHTQTFELK
ncbi:MAG: beta-glucosidase BglX [Clostridia bacterium]|nr:beta-glucosidase BglX [Clostridia bacterium]